MRAILCLTALVIAAGCDRSRPDDQSRDIAEAPAPSVERSGADCSVISTKGLCGVAFGMSAEEAVAAYPGGLYGPDASAEPASEGCYCLHVAENNYDVGFMMLDGKVERIDARVPTLSTEAGAKVGMPFAEVEALYPDAKRQPNKYMAPIEDLIADLGGGIFAIFEQDEAGAVRAFRVGRAPAAHFVEGCA